MKKDNITFQDFIKNDIVVGEVTNAQLVDGSNKLLELTVNMGPDYGERTVFTGMQKWFAPEDFQGKKFLFVANLEPKQMMGRESQGMLLSLDREGAPLLMEVPPEYEAGLKAI